MIVKIVTNVSEEVGASIFTVVYLEYEGSKVLRNVDIRLHDVTSHESWMTHCRDDAFLMSRGTRVWDRCLLASGDCDERRGFLSACLVTSRPCPSSCDLHRVGPEQSRDAQVNASLCAAPCNHKHRRHTRESVTVYVPFWFNAVMNRLVP
jgi:hypothetical protein